MAILGFLKRLGSRMTEATRQGPWLGAYRAAIHRGATPAQAVSDTLMTLKYREPWAQLSDSEVQAFAEVLGRLDRPECFTEVLAEVERTGDLSHVLDIEHLERFVSHMNSQSAR